ncbi:MAG: hypothetical protein E6G56_07300 [Actinobacteria bacterium]|nr:MAG: hypothetical protein E6G56_07300 [Actinomycetota bacterium]
MLAAVAARDLDVVVFGATGVTGRQVVAYLAERAPATGARWGVAARDAGKLERMLGPAAESAEKLVADVTDQASLAAMASRAQVVLNLVGPYTIHAQPVIGACVASGAHYVDLTGEIPFVRRMIEAYDARARDTGVKIVQVCGFEALPPDLAVRLAAELAYDEWGEGLSEVDLAVSTKPPPGMPRPSDMISGGTLQSLAVAVGDQDAGTVSDPAALISDVALAERVRRRSPIPLAPRRDARGAVIAPMAPAPFINPAVIHRTAALIAAETDGPAEPFRYREGIALGGPPGSLPLRYAVAGALSGTQIALTGLTRVRPTVRRRLSQGLVRILPSSGFGPAEDRLEGWHWHMSIDARTAGGHAARVDVDADGHPGYLTTARMVGEAGLMLAAPDLTPARAGCLTPATAIGTASLQRFEHARLRFSASA